MSDLPQASSPCLAVCRDGPKAGHVVRWSPANPRAEFGEYTCWHVYLPTNEVDGEGRHVLAFEATYQRPEAHPGPQEDKP